MYMRHLIDPLDFTVEELDRLLRLGEDIRREPGAYSESCKGKKLATLFYEPSTRTRLSFEAAMLNLGGSVLGFPSANVSSVSKGESVADTIRIVSCYADIAAMRHPLEGAPMRAARFSRIPVINAGDGGHQHPTQTLTDLLTILTRRGRLSHLKIGFCGDLKYGRTVHSLVNALARYEGNEFVFISPEELRVPGHLIENVVKPAHIPYAEVTGLEEAMADLDILYMTRIQKERFTDAGEYERLKGSYVLDMPKMALGKADMAVLHPLPRVNEIALAERRVCAYGTDPDAAGPGALRPAGRAGSFRTARRRGNGCAVPEPPLYHGCRRRACAPVRPRRSRCAALCVLRAQNAVISPLRAAA